MSCVYFYTDNLAALNQANPSLFIRWGFCLLLKLLVSAQLFVAVSPHFVRDVHPLSFHELTTWEVLQAYGKVLELYEPGLLSQLQG